MPSERRPVRGAGAPGSWSLFHVCHRRREASPVAPVREDLSLREGLADGVDAHAVIEIEHGRAGGRCFGCARLSIVESVLHCLACGASERRCSTAHMVPQRGRARRRVCLGNLSASKSSLGPTAQGALGALGGTTLSSSRRFCARRRSRSRTRLFTVALSLDGVMAPMKTWGAREPRGELRLGAGSMTARESGSRRCVWRGWRSRSRWIAQLDHRWSRRSRRCWVSSPDLQLVKIADAANDNWTYLSRVVARSASSSSTSSTPSAGSQRCLRCGLSSE